MSAADMLWVGIANIRIGIAIAISFCASSVFDRGRDRDRVLQIGKTDCNIDGDCDPDADPDVFEFLPGFPGQTAGLSKRALLSFLLPRGLQ